MQAVPWVQACPALTEFLKLVFVVIYIIKFSIGRSSGQKSGML
jgi:hypothetical protein